MWLPRKSEFPLPGFPIRASFRCLRQVPRSRSRHRLPANIWNPMKPEVARIPRLYPAHDLLNHQTSALAAFYPAFRDYFFSGSLSSYTEMLGKREHYWEMNTAYNDVDVGEMLASYAGRGGGIDALAESWAACVVSSGSLNILHQVGSAAVWFPSTRQHFDAWWKHYARLDFAQYRWLTVLNRVYGPPGVAPPAPQVKGHEFILGTLALDLVQPDSPDSLWYELTIYEQNVATQQRQLTPGYWQSGFRVCLPVKTPARSQFAAWICGATGRIPRGWMSCIPSALELWFRPTQCGTKHLLPPDGICRRTRRGQSSFAFTICGDRRC